MAKKVLSAILTLKDQNFSTNMKKAGKGVNDFDRRIQKSKNSIDRFKKNAISSFSSVAKAAAGMAVAYVGFRSLSNFANESVEAAKAQIEAETMLAAVMKNTKGMTDAHIQSIKNYASELQNVGIIGDEVQLSGVQQLATYQLQADTLKTLMPGMNDLLAQQKGLNATQQDAVSIGNMVGKVMNGQVGALSRAGINFTKAQEQVLKYGTEQEKAATLAEVLKMNVGGVNAALAETDQGKIQQMTNAWGDYKEEVGKKILPLQARFAGWFSTKIPKIQSTVLFLVDKGVAGFNKLSEWGQKGFTAISDKAKILKQWGVEAFQKIKEKVAENRPTIDGVKAVMDDLGVKAVQLKDWMKQSFENAKPSIQWLKDEGLPMVVDGISGIIDKATSMYNYVNDNWSTISPLLYGIGGAILFYKGAITAASLATKIYTGVTGALTIAKAAFNAVLLISPLGWIAIAIGAVIAVGVLLYKNWDTISAKGMELWENLKSVTSGIGSAFSSMWELVKSGAKSGVNFVIDGINKVISGFNSLASVKIPGTDIGFDVNIPTIPRFALGTSYFTGGLAQINERGGEIVDLPNGSRVYPHDKSVQMARKEGSSTVFNITINATDRSVSEIMNELVPQIKTRLANI